MGSGTGDQRTVLELVVDRVDVLRGVAEIDAATVERITDRVEYTRPHTNRILNRLCEADLLARSAPDDAYQYSLTFLGRQLLLWYDRGRELSDASPLFEALPPGTTLPYWLVFAGDVTLATAVGGYQLIEPIVDFIERADRFRVAAPTLVRQSGFERGTERALAGELSIEMLLAADFFSEFYRSYRDRFRRLVTEADVSVYTTDNPLPYGFGIGYQDRSREMSVLCYDESHSSLTGILRNDSRPAVDWAEERFETYLADAVDRTDDIRTDSIRSG